MARPPSADERTRHGIGEWYGRSFVRLTPAERRTFAEAQALPRLDRPKQVCLPRSSGSSTVRCGKDGGVCSIRLYAMGESGDVRPATGEVGGLCTTCPHRFEEQGMIYRWIGETLLGTDCAVPLGQVGFLEQLAARDGSSAGGTRRVVGRIDNVLVRPDTATLEWCAVETQAVYFSGDTMATEFAALRGHAGPALPFPAGKRRPDYRSSGPKRLLPQLQIKVPSLSRWGRRVAVVVDDGFFRALGPMNQATDLSNADIVWFVVRYEATGGEMHLRPAFTHMTTLERAVEGLTAAKVVTRETFETRIREKLRKVTR